MKSPIVITHDSTILLDYLIPKSPESTSKEMADAHRRKFDAVIVWRFDRFARSVTPLLRALETFRALGIEFVSLSEQVDTSTPVVTRISTAF